MADILSGSTPQSGGLNISGFPTAPAGADGSGPAAPPAPAPAQASAPASATPAYVAGGRNFNLDEALSNGVAKGYTDIHLRAFDHPVYRHHGVLHRDTVYNVLTPSDVERSAQVLMRDFQRANLDKHGDCDLSYEIPGVSRFRVNIYHERGSLALALRTIPSEVPRMETLGLPIEIAKDFCNRARGIVLVTGPTGSGKSTTLASMINYINESKPCNIITIEDPIEYKHTGKTASIAQRELGIDVQSLPRALSSALRQDPDVILVGEVRDLETIQTALTAAETGHLVFCTLHTNSAVSSVDRIIDVFPAHQQSQIRQQLSMSLLGSFSQMLLPREQDRGGGRVLAMEIMVCTHAVRNMIRESRTHQIGSALEAGGKWNMRTFDMDLLRLVSEGQISKATALGVCHNPDEMRTALGLPSVTHM
jgi:twitching motility protein PilT